MESLSGPQTKCPPARKSRPGGPVRAEKDSIHFLGYYCPRVWSAGVKDSGHKTWERKSLKGPRYSGRVVTG